MIIGGYIVLSNVSYLVKHGKYFGFNHCIKLQNLGHVDNLKGIIADVKHEEDVQVVIFTLTN